MTAAGKTYEEIAQIVAEQVGSEAFEHLPTEFYLSFKIHFGAATVCHHRQQ